MTRCVCTFRTNKTHYVEGGQSPWGIPPEDTTDLRFRRKDIGCAGTSPVTNIYNLCIRDKTDTFSQIYMHPCIIGYWNRRNIRYSARNKKV